MIFVGQESLRRAIREYVSHYHEERNHQGLENRLIRPGRIPIADDANLSVQRRSRLGGMLNYYYVSAA